MSMVHEHDPVALPLSEEEREKVLEQLNRLLETHHFKNSRRYPPLLRFIVEETLAGRGEFLKERLLGVQVFQRPTNYDTASDPIVRVTIAEIRKRIAQYYHDEAHDAEMRIELLPGRYAPEFRARGARRDQPVAGPPVAGAAEPETIEVLKGEAPPVVPAAPRRPARSARALWGLSLSVIFLLAALVYRSPLTARLFPRALDELWVPFLNSDRAILFCVPTEVGKKRLPTGEPVTDSLTNEPSGRKAIPRSGPTFLDYEAMGENVVYSDMLATLHIANVFALHRRDYHVKLNTLTTLEDLRQGPAVLVGGLDNQWTIRALSSLQYRFAGSDEDRYWIADTKNPGFRDWSLDLKQQYGAVTRDYAIIARLRNEQTGQPQMIVAGIGMSGTAAAGEFMSDQQRIEELRRRIGPAFRDHDFEAVLSTDVVNGIAGAPRIIAVSVR